jgi:hypothetical protein
MVGDRYSLINGADRGIIAEVEEYVQSIGGRHEADRGRFELCALRIERGLGEAHVQARYEAHIEASCRGEPRSTIEQMITAVDNDSAAGESAVGPPSDRSFPDGKRASDCVQLAEPALATDAVVDVTKGWFRSPLLVREGDQAGIVDAGH